MSTADHPQTDGQSENQVKTLRFLTRTLQQDQGGDWDLHLSSLEFTYNSSKNGTTGVSPFELLYGFVPMGPLAIQAGHKSGSKAADDFAHQHLISAWKAKKAIEKSQEQQKTQFDKKQRDLEFIGPYFIKKKINSLVYELDLPKGT